MIGVSANNIDTLIKFSVSECRSKLPVATDPDPKLSALDRANRVSYVISPEGKILYEYTSLSADKHVENTFATVKA